MEGQDAIGTFFAAMEKQDWDLLGSVLTEDFQRVGPLTEVPRGRGPYLEFCQRGFALLDEYRSELGRVTYSADRRVAAAENSESTTVAGESFELRQAFIFDMDPTGRIARLQIFQMLKDPTTLVRLGRALAGL